MKIIIEWELRAQNSIELVSIFGYVVDCVELIWEDGGWYELVLYFCLFLYFCFCGSNGECVRHGSMMRCLLLLNDVICLDLFAQLHGWFCDEWIMWPFERAMVNGSTVN